MKVFVLLFSAMLMSCSTPMVVAPRETLALKWDRRPTDIIIDNSMPPECVRAVEKAVDYYYNLGVTHLLRTYLDEPEWIGFHGSPPDGTIVIHFGELGNNIENDAEIAGVAFRKSLKSASFDCYFNENEGCVKYYSIVSVDITLDKCDTSIAAHEIGHALGLEHDNDPENLMFWEVRSIMLNETQIEWIK